MPYTKFQLNPTSGSGEEVENRFQNGRHGGHIGYRIATIWTIVHLLVAPMLHTKFQLNPLLVPQKKKSKIEFEDGRRCGHIGYRILTIWRTVNLIFPKVHTKFGL